MVNCTLKGGSRDSEVNEGTSRSSQTGQILERMNGDAADGATAGPLINSQSHGCKPPPIVCHSPDLYLDFFFSL